MLNISKISRPFFCKFGMVNPKYTIHRSNIKTLAPYFQTHQYPINALKVAVFITMNVKVKQASYAGAKAAVGCLIEDKKSKKGQKKFCKKKCIFNCLS